MLKDNASIKGIVNLVLRDQHGRVKQHKTIRNAVTEDGIAHIIGRMIDTNQDRNGSDSVKRHVIPRMMSHMGIGTGNNATSANASLVQPASTFNRFLQTEITELNGGKRVQLMKDTSLQSEYLPYSLNVGGSGTDGDGNAFDSMVVGETFITIATSAATTGTLRTGMSISQSSNTNIPAGTLIGTIRDGDGTAVNGITVGTGLTRIDLVDSSNNAVAIIGGSAGTVIGATTVDVQYVDVLTSLRIVGSPDYGHPYAGTGASPTFTDYSAHIRGKIGGYYDTQNTPGSIADNSTKAPFFGDISDRPSTDFEQFGTDIDGIFQGERIGSSIVEDVGTSTEGYHPDENDFGVVASPNVSGSGAPTARRGTKKTGTRIVFIGTFKENNPNQTNTLVREAGIFNSSIAHTGYGGAFSDGTTNYSALNAALTANSDRESGYLDAHAANGASIDAVGGGTVQAFSKGSPRGGVIDQTMLCRTTFDVVTKAALDTLQITWSVQLSDQSPV